MSDEIRQAMEIVAVRILEDAAFLFANPMDTPPPRDGSWDPVGAQLSWNGPSTGTMRVWAGRPLLRILAANMLGIEDSDPAADKSGCDALCEVLNMVVGNCLTEAWGPGPVFHLDIPSIVERSGLEDDFEEGFWISADDHPVLFRNESP